MIIRTALPADHAGAIGTLTLAFCVDPMVRWALSNPAKFLAAFSPIAMAFGGRAFEHETAYIAEGFTGTALWLPPGVGSDEETMMKLFAEHTDDHKKEEMQVVFEHMDQFHPTEPHWYLPMIGVDPLYQGAGIGSALMTEALKAVDRDGLIAYLESSNPRNIPLYQRHGFEVIGEIQSGSSPVLRPMLRKAR